MKKLSKKECLSLGYAFPCYGLDKHESIDDPVLLRRGTLVPWMIWNRSVPPPDKVTMGTAAEVDAWLVRGFSGLIKIIEGVTLTDVLRIGVMELIETMNTLIASRDRTNNEDVGIILGMVIRWMNDLLDRRQKMLFRSIDGSVVGHLIEYRDRLINLIRRP